MVEHWERPLWVILSKWALGLTGVAAIIYGVDITFFGDAGGLGLLVIAAGTVPILLGIAA